MRFRVFDLGLVDFKYALTLQKETLYKIKEGNESSTLIFCRHFPVITLGRSSNTQNILADTQELTSKGIQVYPVERGGDVTYHGPGQLTVYPVFDLNRFKKDIHWFLRELEEIAIGCLSSLGAGATRQKGLTGVWFKAKKVASIGIAVKNWITFHGMSINVKKSDLDNFTLIRPCGMDIKVTSLEEAIGRGFEVGEVKNLVLGRFKESFGG